MTTEWTDADFAAAADAVARTACWYCKRTGVDLESCCEHHPDQLVCANRLDCRDYLLAQLRDQD